MPSLSITLLSWCLGAGTPVSSIIVYCLTVSIKIVCAVVLSSLVETHVQLHLSPSFHIVDWLNEADANSTSFRPVFVRFLIIEIISCFTLNAWVVLVATLLLLDLLIVDEDEMARREHILEGHARTQQLWRMLIRVPEKRAIQQAANDDDSTGSDSSWDWVEMDIAPPLAEPEVRTMSKMAASSEFSTGRRTSWHGLIKIPQSMMERGRQRSRFVWTDSPDG